MASVDEILNSMLEEMEKYQMEYNEVTLQINSILKEYTAKIDELQKQRLALQSEGNKKIDELNAKREQLSGKHSSLYEQYKKFAEKEPEFKKSVTIETTNDTEMKLEKSKENKSNKATQKKTVKKLEPKSDDTIKASDGLSPDEIAKLTEIAGKNNSNEKAVVDKNGNEVPEYLQDAYTK